MSDVSTTPLSDAGFSDPVRGAELFAMLGATIDDLRDPVTHAKIAEIASFTSMGPEAHALVMRVLMKGGVKGYPALDKAFQYAKLQKERMALKTKLGSIEKDLSIYE